MFKYKLLGPQPQTGSGQDWKNITGPPQAPPVNNEKRDHQDPPKCNGTMNGSTRAPADSKGPGAAKGENKASEPYPEVPSGTGSTTQPAESSKNIIVCSACGKSGHWSRNCPYYNFCDFVGLPPILHTCAELLSVEPDLQSVYTAVKLNHSSAYCRYRPRHN